MEAWDETQPDWGDWKVGRVEWWLGFRCRVTPWLKVIGIGRCALAFIVLIDGLQEKQDEKTQRVETKAEVGK